MNVTAETLATFKGGQARIDCNGQYTFIGEIADIRLEPGGEQFRVIWTWLAKDSDYPNNKWVLDTAFDQADGSVFQARSANHLGQGRISFVHDEEVVALYPPSIVVLARNKVADSAVSAE